MWTCPVCGREFVNQNQTHFCADKKLSTLLNGKSEHTVALFDHFAEKFKELGSISIHPTKTMIAFSGKRQLVYIIRLGKDFIDAVFPFEKEYPDNLCFHKIAKVPGQQQFNHYFRMMQKEDMNEEVVSYLKLLLANDAR